MKTTVKVTEEHIKIGSHHPCSCPVALALMEAFPHYARVHVSDMYITFYPVYEGIRMHEWGKPDKYIDIPEEARNRITQYDYKDIMEPFEFEIEVD